jgi:predicted enzyme related to lactoylglutathione lyase
MRAFYRDVFQLADLDSGPGYIGLESETWRLTLVRSPQAAPAISPPPRRSATAIKLAFEVHNIEVLRPIIASFGGQVEPITSKWEFRDAVHCDCVDPEGNVVQLIQSNEQQTA